MNKTPKPFIRLFLILLLLDLTVITAFAQSPNDARSYYQEGLRALSIDNPYSAIDSFRSALRLNPAYADARLGMAEALFLLTEYDEAARELEKARLYAKDRREFILLDARIQTSLGEYEKAAGIYSNLIADRPHDADANRGLAEIYAITGQRELADDAFSRSLRYSPGDRRVLLQLVLLHDKSREKTQADAVLLEALRRFPDNLAVRVQAAEHYALYDEWHLAMDQLDRAKSMMNGPGDKRYTQVALLDAELSLRKGDPASALKSLQSLPDDIKSELNVLYLMARSYRDLGEELHAQEALSRLLKYHSEDEIARMYLEEYLMLTSGGFESQRKDAALWHLKKGAAFEENFYYRRAYNEYRRSRLLNNDDPDAWMAYTEILRKLGFPEHYSDSLNAALEIIPESGAEFVILKQRLDLLEHSEKDNLAEQWGIAEPWLVPSAEWRVGVYIVKNTNSLPIHTGSEKTLALYFADLIDLLPDVEVPLDRIGRNPVVEEKNSFADIFAESRNNLDYFILIKFTETERTFSSSVELYLARTGEQIGRFDELRTGQGKVTDTLHALTESLRTAIPRLMAIISVEGDRVLVNKGSWHGIENDEPWIVLRRSAGRPAAVEGGLTYAPGDYLGKIEIVKSSEPLSEGVYERFGDFDFISPGDELFLLPIPETDTAPFNAPDPAFKASLLAIP